MNRQSNNLNKNDANNVVITNKETITVINENILNENQTGTDKLDIDISFKIQLALKKPFKMEIKP